MPVPPMSEPKTPSAVWISSKGYICWNPEVKVYRDGKRLHRWNLRRRKVQLGEWMNLDVRVSRNRLMRVARRRIR